jgi:hypothetical protein
MSKQVVIFIAWFICNITCTSFVPNALKLRVDNTFDLSFSSSLTNGSYFVDLSSLDQYQRSDCYIDLAETYAILNDSDMCENGTSYADFKHMIWKVESCKKSDYGSISTYFITTLSPLMLELCTINNSTIPRFKKDSYAYYVSLVFGIYDFHSEEEIIFDAEFHYDNQPSLSNVLGTNYMLIGPVYHQNAPYGYPVEITGFPYQPGNTGDVELYNGLNYKVVDVSIMMSSFLSHIDGPSRIFSGESTIIYASQNETFERTYETQLEVSDLDSQETTGINIENFLLAIGPYYFKMRDSSYLGSCTPLPKVVVSNGIYRLSPTNVDKCTKHHINLFSNFTTDYLTVSRAIYYFAASGSQKIEYSYNGNEVVAISKNVIQKEKNHFVLNLEMSIGSNNPPNFTITNITKTMNHPVVIRSWKCAVVNGTFQIDIYFEQEREITLQEQAYFINDIYIINLSSDIESINNTFVQIKLFSNAFGIEDILSLGMNTNFKAYEITFIFALTLGTTITTITISMWIYYMAKRRSIII